MKDIRDRYESYKDALSETNKPCGYIDMDLLDTNIQEVINRAENSQVRVASKSVRSTKILHHIIDTHKQIQGIMSYHGREAAFLFNKGFDDILVAYPIADPREITKLVEETDEEANIVVMIDSEEHLRVIDQALEGLNRKLGVCIDIDMSMKLPFLHFGVYRSPLRDTEQILQLADLVANNENVSLDGIMGYEAQIAGLPDTSPSNPWILNKIIQFLKNRSQKVVRKRRAEVVHQLIDAGHDLKLVNGGGTGSVESTIKEEVITEVTVGSGFFAPKLFDYYNQFQHHPASGFALEIVRKPENDIYTCRGGGYIASGSVGKDKQPQPYLPKNTDLVPNEGAGEVQTPVKYSSGKLEIGDPIFFRHAKAGELCEHFNKLYQIRNDTVIGTANTYRGEGMNFL